MEGTRSPFNLGNFNYTNITPQSIKQETPTNNFNLNMDRDEINIFEKNLSGLDVQIEDIKENKNEVEMGINFMNKYSFNSNKNIGNKNIGEKITFVEKENENNQKNFQKM